VPNLFVGPENVKELDRHSAAESLCLRGKSGADIVLFGQGPVEFKYVNPADDPRNAKPASK
jgi:hypothetical protein